MSIIVEHPVFDSTGRLVFAGGPLFLYCKGADSAILARTLPPATVAEGQANAFSKQQLTLWGNDGLRTLAFGSRELVRADYESWNAEYHGEDMWIDSSGLILNAVACVYLSFFLYSSDMFQLRHQTLMRLRK